MLILPDALVICGKRFSVNVEYKKLNSVFLPRLISNPPSLSIFARVGNLTKYVSARSLSYISSSIIKGSKILGRNNIIIFSANSPFNSPIIYCNIWKSLSTPNARNIINNGTSRLLYSLRKALFCPSRTVIGPLRSNCILTVLALANASSLTHLTSAKWVYRSVPLESVTVFRNIIFSALRSCETMTFSAPSIIK